MKKMPSSQPSSEASLATTVDTTLNDFPDDIIVRILSFLPFKQAFRTIVFSKRLAPLRYSLPVHFDHIQTESWIPFRQMLDAVILSPHAQQYSLKTFHIDDCQFELNESARTNINQWLEAAKLRRVEDISLFLILHTNTGITLSPTIFSCKTLVVLKLRFLKVSSMFQCSVDLPLLKTLSLIDIRFNDVEDLKKLIYGCPILEDLKTSCVFETVYFEASAGGVTAGGYSKPLSKLIKVNIRLFEVPLRAFSNVQFLTVTEMGKILPNQEINSYYKGYPVFENLIELRLFWFHHGTRDLIWDDVVKMLQNCPKLQALSITKWTIPSDRGRDDWKYPYHVPECVLSRLKTCTIIGYHAVEADFRFARYILQNARLLQVMTINYNNHSKSKDQRPQFFEDLPSCPRISPVCKLSFI